MANTSRLLLFMTAVEVAGIFAILGGIMNLIPNQGLISASVMINTGAALIALGSLGVAKVYDGETLLGDGGYPQPTGEPSATMTANTSASADIEREDSEGDESKSREEERHITEGSDKTPRFVVESAVRERLAGQNVSTDFYEALDEEVAELIEQAAQRAEEDDRETVQPRDL